MASSSLEVAAPLNQGPIFNNCIPDPSFFSLEVSTLSESLLVNFSCLDPYEYVLFVVQGQYSVSFFFGQ
jgi:hypothetical protein